MAARTEYRGPVLAAGGHGSLVQVRCPRKIFLQCHRTLTISGAQRAAILNVTACDLFNARSRQGDCDEEVLEVIRDRIICY